MRTLDLTFDKTSGGNQYSYIQLIYSLQLDGLLNMKARYKRGLCLADLFATISDGHS